MGGCGSKAEKYKDDGGVAVNFFEVTDAGDTRELLRALYDVGPEQEGILNFAKGDVLVKTAEVDRFHLKGYLEADPDKKEGQFPCECRHCPWHPHLVLSTRHRFF